MRWIFCILILGIVSEASAQTLDELSAKFPNRNFSNNSSTTKFDEDGKLEHLDISSAKYYKMIEDDLELLQFCSDLRSLDLSNRRVDVEAMKAVSKLTRLEQLELNDHVIEGDDLKYLASLENLSGIGLNSRTMRNESLLHLKNFATLKTLNLGGTAVTSECMTHLGQFTELEELILPNHCCTVELRHLKHLKKLKRLRFHDWHDELAKEASPRLRYAFDLLVGELGHSPEQAYRMIYFRPDDLDKPVDSLTFTRWMPAVDDQFVTYLNQFPNLTQLHFAESQFTEAGFRKIQFPTSLRTLRLGNGITPKMLTHVTTKSDLRELGFPANTKDEDLNIVQSMKNLKSIDLSNSKVTAKGLDALSCSDSLREINLAYTNVGDNGLKTLAKMDALTGLNLSGTSITNRGLKLLGRLTNLQSLNLESTSITNDGIAHLLPLTKLAKLTTKKTNVTSEARLELFDLMKLPPRQALELEGGEFDVKNDRKILRFTSSVGKNIGNNHCKLIAQCSLDEVRLYRCPIGEEGIRELAKMNLDTLYLYRMEFMNDQCLQLISKMTQLRELTILNGEGVTDEGARLLKKLNALTRLNVRFKNVSDDVLEELAQAFPEADLYLNN